MLSRLMRELSSKKALFALRSKVMTPHQRHVSNFAKPFHPKQLAQANSGRIVRRHDQRAR